MQMDATDAVGRRAVIMGPADSSSWAVRARDGPRAHTARVVCLAEVLVEEGSGGVPEGGMATPVRYGTRERRGGVAAAWFG